MPKKIPTQSNTLFKYFQSPSSTPPQCPQTMDVEDDAEDTKEKIQPSSKKRLRVIDSDSDNDDSEPSSKPPTSSTNQNKLTKKSTSSSDSNKLSKKFKKEPKSQDDTGADDIKATTSKKSENDTELKAQEQWLHDKLDFLKPNNIRDAQRRKMDNPEYDPHTLYVPESYLNTLTPAMRQWWILKSKHFDTVLFFKVGKFYELYHMDAVIGVNHLGFSFMKGEFAHSGFPEIAYGRFAQTLMEQGFKIARVEQTETPEMMTERCKAKHASKFDKVVNREICQVSTRGCCVYGAQIGDEENPLPVYMLAIAEKEQDDHNIKYGICFVDTSIGVFHMAEFLDDRHCSKLLILLSEHPPTLVLTDRSRTSTTTYDILRKNAGYARIEKLTSSFDPNNIDGLLQKFKEASYFKGKDGNFSWPNVLCDLISDDTCKSGNELTLCALGLCWGYLKDSLLDIQVFTMGQFAMYEPFVHVEVKSEKEYMILDAITMENLNLLGANGTLQKTLDFCCTSFGKRLLQQWICRPLCNIEKINGRQEAIKELYSDNESLNAARDILRKLPDLDRQIMKIHTFGNRQFAEEHPDSRAVLYEAQTYFKRKILVLLNTIKGFETAVEILDIFKGCQSRLLQKITQTPPDGLFCDLKAPLQYFQMAFDHKEAESQGKIIPQVGVDEDYDNAEIAIKGINKELDQYLEEQSQFFGCKVRYFGNDKKRYQLEVPANRCHKVNSEYTMEGTKKGSNAVNRYTTVTTKELLAKMIKAENHRAQIIKDFNRRIFEKFSRWHEEWDQVTRCLAMLDTLCSLAKYARTYSHDICLPIMLPFTDKPFIKIENGRHPCIPKIDDYVPNDTELGIKDKPGILILTGPNMGGKSTLMRQVALIIVMAQIGSYIPATSCEITLIDRIFTRLGAQDDIISGQSTFFVEVSEASAILQHATKQSFVLLDELGRGTSTHDGNAIATAYMKKLLEIDCRVIYSTHYHTLVEHYGGRTDVQLGHMAYMIEDDEESGEQGVTFLYKLEPGVCSNSYGFNVAKLAGLPENIIQNALKIATKLESSTIHRQLYIQLLTANNASIAREAMTSLRSLETV
ncbi:putative component of the post-replicative DNA mismatch repair system (MMR) [Trypoxylus dichotomus]